MQKLTLPEGHRLSVARQMVLDAGIDGVAGACIFDTKTGGPLINQTILMAERRGLSKEEAQGIIEKSFESGQLGICALVCGLSPESRRKIGELLAGVPYKITEIF